MKYSFVFLSLFIFSNTVLAQEKPKDSVGVTPLEEVVVTGQFEPQSIKKSVFNVRVISQEDIKNLAANNLADVLNQYLNITVRPDSETGRSTVSLFGLDAQYFKILVDNIPLVSDSGIGNNIDLNQINLNDVEQLEIIEGSMGVTHGANAVSGILNIITKKTSKYKWEVAASAQEETVGEEYAMFNKGRHIQNLKIGHKITDKWYASIGANRNDFNGFEGLRRGKNHSINDLTRGYMQLPKEQFFSNAMLSYKSGDFRMFYKFDYLTELIEFYGRTVTIVPNPPFGETKSSNDERFWSDRFYHHLNATGKLFSQLQYNVSLSHQLQTRDVEKFKYNLTNSTESEKQKIRDQSTELIYSTGTISNFFVDKKADLQFGYEFENAKGYARVDAANGHLSAARKSINHIDYFVSSEIKATSKFSIRPGFRYSFQSLFDDQYAASLGFRYLFENNIEARTALGKSFRTPNFDELYSEFIIPSHTYLGNENLLPEQSISYEASIKKMTTFSNSLRMSNTISASHLDVKDKISSILIEIGPPSINRYENINNYKVINLASTNQFQYKDLTFSAGVSFVWISQKIDNGVIESDDKYLLNLQMNSSISYNVDKWKSVFALFYKYNGKEQQFQQTNDETGNPVYRLTERDPYSWLEASASKSFFKEHFNVTLGVRNLLDVTTVRQSNFSSGAAHPVDTNVSLAYGRSYYVKLTYNLNF